ncbi:hypothetical protein [Rhizobium wuzhouense]|uniref:DUF697 domain-containing protein n=1 Tax=Rhizobium wuzhouense TaxID=1986026 RepID=A0ABX5NUS9_9HYPH|nr:hypothetical protein [Rhizobium wuzhouense]PYB76928.1 hypothetical protein DMY87_00580 [Rhizobium wuzhouense]
MRRDWWQVLFGFSTGILALSIIFVAACKITAFGANSLIYFVFWLGGLGWLHDYQGLITGIGALVAAYFSVREIRCQIASSEAIAQKQIASAENLERERREARKSANLAVSPLILSSICQYAETNGRILESLLSETIEKILPNKVKFEDFSKLPTDVTPALKELVEVLSAKERWYFQRLLYILQVEASKLSALKPDLMRGTIVTRSNLESLILGQAAVYAEASALFGFGRSSGFELPRSITKADISTALFLLGLHGIRDDLIERYKLDEDKVWNPYSFGAHLKSESDTFGWKK